jgi:hypothetical protein
VTTDVAIPIITHIVVGTGPYSVEWPYGVDELVVRAELAGVITTLTTPDQWTVSPSSSANTGAVTLSGPAATAFAGARLTIERNTVQEQGWQGQSGREIGLMAALDRTMRSVQDLRARTQSTLRLNGGAAVPPIAALTSGATLIWNGATFVPGPTADDIEAAQEFAQQAEAWAENPTPPNPLDPTSKSAKAWASDAAEAADRAEAVGIWDTRAAYAAWVAAGGVPVAGRTYWVRGVPFLGSPGATWTGLTGLVTHPLHPVRIEHYGGGTSASGVSSATNDAALAAWYASVLSFAQADRVLNFGYGSYGHNTWPAVDVNNAGFRGVGPSQTIMVNLSTTSDGPSFGPAEGVATGNTRFGNFLDGIQFTRSGTGATAGTGVTWRFCSQPRMRGVRISQYYNQMEEIACQDEDFSDYELYAPFYFDFVSPARPNSFCLRVRPGLKAGATYQAKWQSRHRGFNIAGCWNTENVMILEGGDGSMYSDGYVNGGRNSLIKFTGNAAYNAGSVNYNSSHFSNVYFDGGRPSQNVSYCIDCDDASGNNYLTAVFQGGVIANSKTAVVNVRGTNNMRLQLDGVLMNGWGDEEAPRLFDVNNPNAKVFINNCIMQNSHRSIRLQSANVVHIKGGWLFNGHVSFSGIALQITGQVDFLTVDGVFLDVWSGSTAISDTGTGRRSFSNLQGDWPSSVVPSFTFENGNAGVAYAGTRELRYERMGPLVYIALTLSLSSKGTSTGEARITGLPFNADTFTNYSLNGVPGNLARARAGVHIAPNVNFDNIRFIYTFDNGSVAVQATLQHTDITDTTIFRIAGWYPILNAGNI